jgi:hypothetical protein
MNKYNNIVLIHIGKCGGSTISEVLNNHHIPHSEVHIHSCKFDSTRKYLIVIRNPIQRFISAFNWRYKLVVDDKTQSNRFRGEKETLEKYGTVNNLAENIDIFDVSKTYIHHIKEDIHHYLGDFLKDCKKENILGVITTETLDSDCLELFGAHNKIRARANEKNYTKTLSPLGYDKLKKYLHKDYECITKLFELGLLTEEKYKILSESFT